MNSLSLLEQKLGKHFLFIYNNLNRGDESIIDSKLVNELYTTFKHLQTYNTINIILHTGGGNLAAGTRIINCLREMYEHYEFAILDRCHSTGTFIALSSSHLYVTPKSIITPCEPQLTYHDKSISTATIRNLLKYFPSTPHITTPLEPDILASYYSTINYFKDLCYSIYSKDQADLIIDYMLNKVNSHQFPIPFETLASLGLPVTNIYHTEIETILETEANLIHQEFEDQKTSTELETRMTIISSSNSTRAYCKKYKRENHQNIRYFEGYCDIERR